MKLARYIKHGSHTQQVCNSSIHTVYGIMQRIHITYEEWLMLLFKTGCLLVERQEPDARRQKELLQDVQHGFWAWWLGCYIQHDAILLQRPIIGGYVAEKMKLLQYIQLEFLTETLPGL